MSLLSLFTELTEDVDGKDTAQSEGDLSQGMSAEHRYDPRLTRRQRTNQQVT